MLYEKLIERFPKLALLSLTWEAGAFPREEITPFCPGPIQALYIYGLGQGAPYQQMKSWLHENKERRLIFLEDDPNAIASLQEEELLADPQVHLSFFTKEEIPFLASQFPFHQIDIVALPSRQNKNFRFLKLQLLRTTTLTYALHLDRLCGYQPFHNFLKNTRHIPHSFYANQLHGTFSNVPAIVCGAGPSLNEAIPLLEKLQDRALLIAGGSAIAALSARGIIPHFGVAIDPNHEEYKRLKNCTFPMPLLYSTRLHPDVLNTCKGPFGYMRSGIGGVPEIFLEEKLDLLGPPIGGGLSSESIAVTPICAAWAQFLGCSPIFFCGVDLAYTQGKRYADGVLPIQGSLPFKARTAADRMVKRKNQNGQRVHTAIRWVMESASLAHFAKQHASIPFFNTSAEGLPIKGIPYLSLADAADRYLTQPLNLRARVQQEIARAPMPSNTQEIIRTRLQELYESISRVLDHLAILSGKKTGSKALAEVELEEEVAMSCLFYDIEQIFPDAENRWEKFFSLAQKYDSIICREKTVLM